MATPRSPLLALAAFVLGTAAPLLAQDYRWEEVEDIGIKYRVYKKLTRVPLKLGQSDGMTRAQYKPDDPGDYIHGAGGVYSWDLFVYEFVRAQPKAPKEGDQIDAATKALLERIARMRFKSYEDFVTKDPGGQKDRKVLLRGKEVAAKGKTPAFKLWEWVTIQDGRTPDGRPAKDIWYRQAAAYDLGEREVVIECVLPVKRGDRPDQKFLSWAQTMVTSLQPLKENAGGAGSLEEKVNANAHAATDQRKRELTRAYKNISDFENWDLLTTPNFIVMFTWDKDKPDKRMQAESEAKALAGRMDKMRELYQQYYPPHDRMGNAWSVLRICSDYDTFRKYSGPDVGGGTVGWFNPGSKELVIFMDREKWMGKGGVDTVAYHEGWHQYSDAYFRAPVAAPKTGETQKPAETQPENPNAGLIPGVELHRWFDEGTGDYFGSYELRNGRWVYAASKMRKRDIAEIVTTKKWVPLREIVSWNKDKFYGGRASDYYAQGYSMVDFFRRGKAMGNAWDPAWEGILDKYREVMLRSGNQKKAVEEAFAGVDWAKLEEAWVRWVREYMNKV